MEVYIMKKLSFFFLCSVLLISCATAPQTKDPLAPHATDTREMYYYTGEILVFLGNMQRELTARGYNKHDAGEAIYEWMQKNPNTPCC